MLLSATPPAWAGAVRPIDLHQTVRTSSSSQTTSTTTSTTTSQTDVSTNVGNVNLGSRTDVTIEDVAHHGQSDQFLHLEVDHLSDNSDLELLTNGATSFVDSAVVTDFFHLGANANRGRSAAAG